MPEVYLDNAATTALSDAAREAIEDATARYPANPNSLHTQGRRAAFALEEAREEIAGLLGAHMPSEIVFTSGGTESDVSALEGIMATTAKHRRRLIVSAIEHHAVLRPAARLGSVGYDVTYLPPDANGFIDPSTLQSVIDDDTALVSVQLANNEVGTIQPIDELADIAHAHGALFHTDAVQAVGRCALSLDASRVDAASFSSHKFHGPHGFGMLYLRAGTPFRPLITGGGQEEGRRSGTQNVASALGTAAALREVCGQAATECVRERQLQSQLISLIEGSDGLTILCDPRTEPLRHLPNLVAMAVEDWESSTLVLRLDAAGYEVSGGSACSSDAREVSHVLTAIGIDEDQAAGQLRVTLGRESTEQDIIGFAHALRNIIEEA